MGPYAYKGDQWVSFDDTNMIQRKSQYIKDMQLGGGKVLAPYSRTIHANETICFNLNFECCFNYLPGMIWALDLDDFRGVCGCEKHPLLKTINRVLRNYPEPAPQCNKL